LRSKPSNPCTSLIHTTTSYHGTTGRTTPRMIVWYYRDVHHFASPHGDRHPHELPDLNITITNMFAYHWALLEWLIVGTPHAPWQIGCLHQAIHPLSRPTPAPTLCLASLRLRHSPRVSLGDQSGRHTSGHPRHKTRPLFNGQWATHTPNHCTLYPCPCRAPLRLPNHIGDARSPPVPSRIATGPRHPIPGIGILRAHLTERTNIFHSSEPRPWFRNGQNATPDSGQLSETVILRWSSHV
jgi:hypothetical protein